MKTVLTFFVASILMPMLANAQPSPAQTQTTSAVNTTSTGVTENTGTITEFTPGSTIVLNTGATEPVHYKLGKTVVYVNAKGKEITAAKMRKDRKVRVHYVKDGNDMVVDKITIVRD